MKSGLLARHSIVINQSPEAVFEYLETTPNKFPIFKALETKPFLFIRILLVDGPRSAMKATSYSKWDHSTGLRIGEAMGPFTLIESNSPKKYWFDLTSTFINCQTGYILSPSDGKTRLDFDITVDDLTVQERIWWLIFKPFHSVFANKVLRVLKENIESPSSRGS